MIGWEKKIDWHQMGGAGSLSKLVNQTVIGRNSHRIINTKKCLYLHLVSFI